MFKKLTLIFIMAFLTTFAYSSSLTLSNRYYESSPPVNGPAQSPEISPETPSPTISPTPLPTPAPTPTATPSPTPEPTPKPTPKPTLKPAPSAPIAPGAKTAYITIDDGPSKNTMRMLDILHDHDVKATFFVNGREGSYYENLYKEIVNRGHVLANHTYSHDYSYIYSSVENFMRDYDKLNDYLYRITGVKPQIMRFPGGSNNQVSWQYSGKTFMKEKLIPAVLKKGYAYFDWNISIGDTAASVVPAQTLINNVKNQIGNKSYAIILMHDLTPKTTTADALPEIIKFLKSKGYEFKTMNKDSPPHRFQ